MLNTYVKKGKNKEKLWRCRHTRQLWEENKDRPARPSEQEKYNVAVLLLFIIPGRESNLKNGMLTFFKM